VGIGNSVSAILGGLPMISEVARSSANVNNGAKTRWANFFHGFFILLFLCFTLQFSDVIPNAALAAMLIGVGYRLANPKEFAHMLHIGWEQLLIFCSTIVITLATDLLVGIGAGILVKLLIENLQGVPISSAFKAHFTLGNNTIRIHKSAVFSNWLGIQSALKNVDLSSEFCIDLSDCKVVDHTVMENIQNLQRDFANHGGSLIVEGVAGMLLSSKYDHPLSFRKR